MYYVQGYLMEFSRKFLSIFLFLFIFIAHSLDTVAAVFFFWPIIKAYYDLISICNLHT